MAFNVAQLLQTATVAQTGAVQVGSGLSITPAGLLSLAGGTSFPGTVINVPSTFPGSIGSPWNSGFANLTAGGCIEISTDNTTFTQGPLPINNGDTLYVRWATGISCTGAAQGTIITGSITDGVNTFTANFIVDRIPNAFALDDLQDVGLSATVTSNPTFLTGLTVPAYVTLGPGATITNVQASIGGGAFVAIPTSGTTLTINPTQSIQLRGTVGPTNNTTYTASIRIGDATAGVTVDNWDVRTIAVTPVVSQPSITSPTNGATGLNPLSNTPAGIPLVASSYSASNGAGTHANTDWETYLAGEYNPVTSGITSVSVSPNFPVQYTSSVRFSPEGQNTFTRSPSVGGNRQTFTWSIWAKLGDLGTRRGLVTQGNVSSDYFAILFDEGNRIQVIDVIGNVTTCNIIGQTLYNNVEDWYHVVVAIDTTQSISVNRVKIYINGTQITTFNTNTTYPLNTLTTCNSNLPIVIGAGKIPASDYFDGSLTGIYFIDGFQLTSSSFATGIAPIDFTGSYGTNGFELLFSTGTLIDYSSTTLGADTSGNNNNFTPNGMSIPLIKFDNPTDFPPIDYIFQGEGSGQFSNPYTSLSGGGAGGLISASNLQITSTNNIFTLGSSSSYHYFKTISPVASIVNDLVSDANSSTSGFPQLNKFGDARIIGGNPGGTYYQPGGGGSAGIGSFSNGGPGTTLTLAGITSTYCTGGNGGWFVIASDGAFSYGNRGTGHNTLTIAYPYNPFDPKPAPTFQNITAAETTPTGYRVFTIKNPITSRLISQWWRNVDSPTPGTTIDTGLGGEIAGNYPIFDPFFNGFSQGGSISNAGTTISGNNANIGAIRVSKPMPTTGKYYWEIESTLYDQSLIGILVGFCLSTTNLQLNPGVAPTSVAVNTQNGSKVQNNASLSYGTAITPPGIIGIAYDADFGRFYVSYNNVWLNSGDPVVGTNPAFDNLVNNTYYFCLGGAFTGSAHINFGQLPFVYPAPTGYKCLVDDPVVTTLTFNNNLGFANMVVGDRIQEQGGDASGQISAINSATNQLTIINSSGVWNVGSTVTDQSQLVTTAPTSDPPNPSIYQQVVNQSADPSNLTSYNIPSSSLLPQNTYYSRVRYRSNDASPVVSQWSAWNGFKTGTY